MEPIHCPADDSCPTKFNAELDSQLLIKLIDVHVTRCHPVAAAPVPVADQQKTERMKRPVVSAGGSSAQWRYFETRWDEFKAGTGLPPSKYSSQAMECCDDALRLDITRHFGSVVQKPEAEVLACIKYFALRSENIMVERDSLRKMTQDRNETIRGYVARLRGQANVCQFLKKWKCSSCDSDGSAEYTDDQVKETLVNGMYDQEIKLELLGQSNQNMALEECITFIEAKESGRRAASRLNVSVPTGVTSSNAISSYKRSSKDQHKPARPASPCAI